MRVLFSGSREATQVMKERARAGVRWAMANGHTVIVGDADGIDQTVITACDVLGVPVTVYGAKGMMRNKTTRYTNIALDCGYYERDRVMCYEADVLYALWNGHSRGTRYTYEFMRNIIKPASLINFGGSNEEHKDHR